MSEPKASRARVHDQGGTPAAAMTAPAETPTQTMIKATAKVGETTDELGRRIVARRLTPLDRMRLFQAAGNDLAKNEQWIGLAALAASCIELAGDQVAKPVSKAQIEALVERLGDEGLSAIAEIYQETFGVTVEDDVVATAKN